MKDEKGKKSAAENVLVFRKFKTHNEKLHDRKMEKSFVKNEKNIGRKRSQLQRASKRQSKAQIQYSRFQSLGNLL